jgi:aminoglycoside 6'-N-acetyltransferase
MMGDGDAPRANLWREHRPRHRGIIATPTTTLRLGEVFTMTIYLIQHGQYAIRLMHDLLDDYTILAQWLTDPIVLEYYEGRDNPFPLERVYQKYAPRVQRLHSTVPCFMLDRDKPIGYLQFSPLSPADCAAFDLPTTACAFGMDLFIGESSRWNRGLGTTYVQLATHYLVEVCAASYITLDPRVDNLRAIRCYEKCGFRRRKLLAQHEYHEGAYRDCWLMVYTQPE